MNKVWIAVVCSLLARPVAATTIVNPSGCISVTRNDTLVFQFDHAMDMLAAVTYGDTGLGCEATIQSLIAPPTYAGLIAGQDTWTLDLSTIPADTCRIQPDLYSRSALPYWWAPTWSLVANFTDRVQCAAPFTSPPPIDQPPLPSVPEPASMLLMGMGLLGVARLTRRHP